MVLSKLILHFHAKKVMIKILRRKFNNTEIVYILLSNDKIEQNFYVKLIKIFQSR